MTTIRRQMKNMVKNYSEAEVKVREATSNDPWGPSSTLMAEIADLTYNIVALGEVMRMIWKRLNDHGKNWRHVYKSLVLLDYLIKNGNEKVAQQCKEHIVAIQTLKDFQFMDEGRDQGASVREKAKQLVNLLRDDERLKQERTKALHARERFAQNAMGISSDNRLSYATAGYPASSSSQFRGAGSAPSGDAAGASALSPDLEAVRPSDASEEELQVKLAMMLSQQEHEEEVQRKRADDAKLQIALEQSKIEGAPNGLVDLTDINDPWGDSKTHQHNSSFPSAGASASSASTLDDDDFFASSKPISALRTSTSVGAGFAAGPIADPWSTAAIPASANSKMPVSMSTQHISSQQQQHDPWAATTTTTNNKASDPWSSTATLTNATANGNKADDFDLFSTNRTNAITTTTTTTVNNNANSDPFGDFFGGGASSTTAASTTVSTSATKTNPWTSSTSTTSASIDSKSKTTTTALTAPTNNRAMKTPESFLGENSGLVNLENLIPTTTTTTSSSSSSAAGRPKSTNPFGGAPAVQTPPATATASAQAPQVNPFGGQQQPRVTTPMMMMPAFQPPQPAFGGLQSAPFMAFPNTQPPFMNPGAMPPIMPGLGQFPALQHSAMMPPTMMTAQPPSQSQANSNAAAASTNPFLMM